MIHYINTKREKPMDRGELGKILHRWNPWWAGQRPVLPDYLREEFAQLNKERKERKISIITIRYTRYI